MQVEILERDIVRAAGEGMDAFLDVVRRATLAAVGGELTATTMPQLTPDQVTLLAYMMYRDEVMDGGHVQLIHNGYGPFIFLNPFAKAMRLWGAKAFCNLVYDGRRLYERYGAELERDCSDEAFMALFEQYPEFDELDDAFVEMEEELTALVAHYVDDHLDAFCTVKKEAAQQQEREDAQ